MRSPPPPSSPLESASAFSSLPKYYPRRRKAACRCANQSRASPSLNTYLIRDNYQTAFTVFSSAFSTQRTFLSTRAAACRLAQPTVRLTDRAKQDSHSFHTFGLPLTCRCRSQSHRSSSLRAALALKPIPCANDTTQEQIQTDREPHFTPQLARRPA